jgi:hypothetical protein
MTYHDATGAPLRVAGLKVMSFTCATARALKSAQFEGLLTLADTTSPVAETLTMMAEGVTRPLQVAGAGRIGELVGLGRVSQQ